MKVYRALYDADGVGAVFFLEPNLYRQMQVVLEDGVALRNLLKPAFNEYVKMKRAGKVQ